MNNKKFCSFYVSEFHLFTILLPYIDEKILEKKQIAIILQEDMTNSIKEYVKKVKIFDNDKILKLGWKKNKNEDMKNEEIVIVVGNEKYIEEINEKLDREENIEEIINCYQIEDIEEIDKIVSKYKMILNSKGKNYLEKNSQNAQKRNTIKSQI